MAKDLAFFHAKMSEGVPGSDMFEDFLVNKFPSWLEFNNPSTDHQLHFLSIAEIFIVFVNLINGVNRWITKRQCNILHKSLDYTFHKEYQGHRISPITR